MTTYSTPGVKSQCQCQMVVGFLVYKSQWFEVEPLPDDHYRITVKIENMPLLERLLTATDVACHWSGLTPPKESK